MLITTSSWVRILPALPKISSVHGRAVCWQSSRSGHNPMKLGAIPAPQPEEPQVRRPNSRLRSPSLWQRRSIRRAGMIARCVGGPGQQGQDSGSIRVPRRCRVNLGGSWIFKLPFRACSSAGERCLHTADAAGSIPATPTIQSMAFTLVGADSGKWDP